MKRWAWKSFFCMLWAFQQTTPYSIIEEYQDSKHMTMTIKAVGATTAISQRVPGSIIIRDRDQCNRWYIVDGRGRASPSACTMQQHCRGGRTASGQCSLSSSKSKHGRGAEEQGGGHLSFAKQGLLLMQNWGQRLQIHVAGCHKPPLLIPGQFQCTLQKQIPWWHTNTRRWHNLCAFGMLVERRPIICQRRPDGSGKTSK